MKNNKIIPISAKNIKKLSDTFTKKNILKHQTILERNVKDTALIYKKQSSIDMNMILEILYYIKTMQHTTNFNFQMVLQKQQIQNILNSSILGNELKEVKNLLLSEENCNTVLIEKAINCIENILKKNDILNHKENIQQNFNDFYSNNYFFNIINNQQILNKKNTLLRNIDFENKTISAFMNFFNLRNAKNTKYQILFRNKINSYFITDIHYLKEDTIQKNNSSQIKIITLYNKILKKQILKNFTNSQNNILRKQNTTFLKYSFQNKNNINILQQQIQYFLYNYRYYKNVEIENYSNQKLQNRKKYLKIWDKKTVNQIKPNRNIVFVKEKQKQYFNKILNYNSTDKNIKEIYDNIILYSLSVQNEFLEKRNSVLYDTTVKKLHFMQFFAINNTEFCLFKNFYKKLEQQKIKLKILQNVLLKYSKNNDNTFYTKQYKNEYYRMIKNFQKYHFDNKYKTFYNTLYQIKTIKYHDRNKWYLKHILQNKMVYFDWQKNTQYSLHYGKRKTIQKKERKIKQQNLIISYKNKLLKYQKEKNILYKNILTQKEYYNKEKIENNQSIIILNKRLLWRLESEIIKKNNKIYSRNLLLKEKEKKIENQQGIIIYNQDFLRELVNKEIEKDNKIYFRNLLLKEKEKKIENQQGIIVYNQNFLWELVNKEIKKDDKIENPQDIIIYSQNFLQELVNKEIERDNKIYFRNLLLKEKKKKIENNQNILKNLYYEKGNIIHTKNILLQKRYKKKLKDKQNIVALYKDNLLEQFYQKKENIKYKIKQDFSEISRKNSLYSKKQISKTIVYKKLLHLLFNQQKITAIPILKNNLLWKQKNQKNTITQIIMQNKKNEIEKTENSLVFLKNKKEILNEEQSIIMLQKKEVLNEKQKDTIQLQQLQQIIKKEVEILLQKQIKQQQIILQQYTKQITEEQINFQKQFDQEKLYQKIYQNLERALYREKRQYNR